MSLGPGSAGPTAASSALAADARSLDSLKATASSSPEKATKLAAREFEALFLNQLLKSMRESLPKDGPFSSQAGNSYTQMLDQELSKSLAAKGTGLATMIEKQLLRSMTASPAADGANALGAGATPAVGAGGVAGATAVAGGSQAGTSATAALAARAYADPRAAPAAGTTAANSAPSPAANSAPSTMGTSPTSTKGTGASSATGSSASSATAKMASAAKPSAAAKAAAAKAAAARTSAAQEQSSFLSKVTDMARASASAAGLSPVFVAAQAALESGWGKHQIRNADGTSAHNLFGIKAGSNWKGPTVSVTTVEYQNGVPVKRVEKFRAYASYAEGLADYVGLLASNARYKEVVANGKDAKGFAQAMGRSGYATDPAYSQKLASLIDKAKNLTGQA